MKHAPVIACLLALLGTSGARATTLSVCASGCLFTDPAAAFNQAINAEVVKPQAITVSIADGTYTETNQIYTENPLGRFVQVIGDQANPARVVLNFTNITGNNFNGFAANAGGAFGLIDGLTIRGTGPSQTGSSGRVWASQSYGSGIVAGSGATVQVGPHVAISGFYYAVSASNGGIVTAPSGGVSGSQAGGADFAAFGRGTIVCNNCSAQDAVDTTSGRFGCGALAQNGGSLYVDGLVIKGAGLGAVCASSQGRVWAHGVTASGTSTGNDFGAMLVDHSSAELTGSAFIGYGTGVYASIASYADLDNVVVSTSTADGVVSDNGTLDGNNVTSQNSGGFGFHAFHQGVMHLYNTLGNTRGNLIGPTAADGSETMNAVVYQPSSITIQ